MSVPWLVFGVEFLLVSTVMVVFTIPDGKALRADFWRTTLRGVRAGVPFAMAAVRRDVAAEGVPLASRVRRVVFAVPEVARASCYSVAVVLAEVEPENEVEMRLWRPVYPDVHPVVLFVGWTYMVFFIGFYVLFPPPIDWSANPFLISVWVVQGVAFVGAATGDILWLGRRVWRTW